MISIERSTVSGGLFFRALKAKFCRDTFKLETILAISFSRQVTQCLAAFAMLFVMIGGVQAQSPASPVGQMPSIVSLLLDDQSQSPVDGNIRINFIEPRNNNRFVEGDNILVRVEATTQNGQISKAELRVDNVSQGVDSSAPYNWTLSNLSVGSHTLTAVVTSAEGKESLASITITVIQDTSTNGGFTRVVASADSRVMYVSSSQGSDAGNNCQTKSNPCAKIEHAITFMRSGYPDHVLLKRGDRWRLEGQPLPGLQHYLDGLKSGRSSSEPAVLSYYGDSGPRPIIESNLEVYRQARPSRVIKHFHWIGLHFYGFKKDPNHPEFERDSGNPELRFIGGFDDILLEDNKFEHSGFTVQPNNVDKTYPSNFTARRNIMFGSYVFNSSYDRSGRNSLIYAERVDGLILDDNVFDQGGWNPSVRGAGANQLSHNIYLQARSNGNRLYFRNNICTRAASHCVQLRSGGVATDNFIARNAIGLLMGYGREPIPANTRARATDNVVIEGSSMYRGVDPCVGPNLCSRAIWGFEFVVNSNAKYEARGNIAARLSPNNNEPNSMRFSRNGFLHSYDNGQTTYPQSNNIVYNWSGKEPAGPNYVDPDRTLGDYHQSIGGSNDFDAFMNVVLNRPVGTWDERYEAKSINAYIRAGFQVAP